LIEKLEEVFRVLETQKKSKIVWTLFRKGEQDLCSLMDCIDYPSRYKSKFVSRYISKLQDLGYIDRNNGHYFLTPHGALFLETLGDLAHSNLKMSNKVRLLKLLRKPKTMEQLYSTLEISRMQCHQLLKCLKKRGFVKAEAQRYRIRPPIRLKELKNIPFYYWKLLQILLAKESCSAQELATATELALKGVQTRLSELKRMNIVESTGPDPLPQGNFFKFYRLTAKGNEILEKIDEFERQFGFIDLIFQLLSEEQQLTERELWRTISKKMDHPVNTFDVRHAINFLKKIGFLDGDIVNGYVRNEIS
jgi:predicted transcriptional regulator